MDVSDAERHAEVKGIGMTRSSAITVRRERVGRFMDRVGWEDKRLSVLCNFHLAAEPRQHSETYMVGVGYLDNAADSGVAAVAGSWTPADLWSSDGGLCRPLPSRCC
jgi:hypothetical protein